MSYELTWGHPGFSGITGRAVGLPEVDVLAELDDGASGSNPNSRVALPGIAPEIVGLASHYENSPINAYPKRIFATLAAAMVWVINAPPL